MAIKKLTYFGRYELIRIWCFTKGGKGLMKGNFDSLIFSIFYNERHVVRIGRAMGRDVRKGM